MSPVTHFLAGWLVANAVPLNRRERTLVTLAGVLPDLDGLGLVAEIATRQSAHPLNWWTEYHHLLGHNLGFALLVGAVSFALAKRRSTTALLALASFHLHLLGDLAGARGPDGHQWPIPYLLPFSTVWQLAWSGQWALNAWPNFLITGAALAWTFQLAWQRGYSPMEIFSTRADRAFVVALRNRFPWNDR